MSDVELPAFVPKKTSMAAVSHSEMKGTKCSRLKGHVPLPKVLQGENVHPYKE